MKYMSRQDGFTLLELLLVIAVSGLLLLGITQLTRAWVDSETATGAGQHLERVSAVVEKYIEANWSTLTDTSDAMTDGNWTGLVDNLNKEGLLNSGNLLSPLGTPLKIGYRIDTSVTPNVYRAVIWGTQPILASHALDAARQAGNVGGTMSPFPNGTLAIGSFGQWRIAKTSLLPGGTDPCPASNTAGGSMGCIVAVVSFTNDSLEGPYLYRNAITGRQDLNTMNTTLFMNNHDVTGASNINTADLDVTNTATLGTTTINGPAAINSDATVTNGVTVNGNMAVTGDANFSNNVNIAAGNLNTKDLHADTVQAPVIRTNNLDSADITVNNGDMTVDDDINVNGGVNMAAGTGEILANTINAGNINADNGQMTVGSMNIQNAVNVTGNLNVTSGSVDVNRLVADHCVNIKQADGTTKSYGICP